MKLIYMIFIFLSLLCACSYMLKQDVPVEEMVEDAIKYETGIELDVSPGIENAIQK